MRQPVREPSAKANASVDAPNKHNENRATMMQQGPKKYGLVIPARPGVRPPAAAAAGVGRGTGRPASTPTPLAAFQEEEEDDNDEEEWGEGRGPALTDQQMVNRRLQREAERNLRLKQVDDVHAKALAEDPTIFDYDTAHDVMKAQQQSAHGPAAAFTGGGHVGGPKEPAASKPKYIGALLEMAAERKREQERVMIRKLQRDREKEGDEFADKEQFVTAAYKEKLIEERRLAELERARDVATRLHVRIAARDDVRKKNDLTSFYRNLLSVNDVAGSTHSLPETASSALHPPSPAAATPSHGGTVHAPPTLASAPAPVQGAGPAPSSPDAKRPRTETPTPPPAYVAPAAPTVDPDATAPNSIAEAEAAKRMSARERYLARKRQEPS